VAEIATANDAQNTEKRTRAAGTCQSTAALSRTNASAPSRTTSICPTNSTTCGKKLNPKTIAASAPTLAST
jgi:hypothetical protein